MNWLTIHNLYVLKCITVYTKISLKVADFGTNLDRSENWITTKLPTWIVEIQPPQDFGTMQNFYIFVILTSYCMGKV